ncbi:hypothetical protein HY442_00610, partial [Candidatus Parcubacteria bacterium]|nr:hypothetical protein [Candidatus Parcubacteria bacterium]
ANIVQGEPPAIRSDLSDEVMPVWQRVGLRLLDITRLDRWVVGTGAGIALYRLLLQNGRARPFRQLVALMAELGVRASLRRYDHHLCHLFSAAYTSGLPECLVVSIDGFGDGLAGRVAVFKHGKLRQVTLTPIFHSIGVYYLFATNLCGFAKVYHCGKTTGLAAYVAPGGKALGYFRRVIAFDPRRGAIVNRGRFLYAALGEMRRELAGVSREEIAAAIQAVSEEVTVAFVRHWLRATGQHHLVLTGGFFANVKLNQRVAAIPGVERIFIHPHMGDGGLATGAAYGAALEFEPAAERPTPYRLSHVFLGSDLSGENLPRLLQEASLTFSQPADIDHEVAKLLAEGKVVARVAGSMEYGPRALGNRSILYQATDPTVNTWLNQKLKRSEFMPFAPMVLEEDAPKLFRGYSEQNAHAAEFMTITYDVTDQCKRESPAVVHVDGTARPQVIREAVNPHCFRILRRYRELTGLHAIINTSYNMHDEPIVRTAEDAIRAFLASKLDYLVLDDYLVWRP